MSRTRKFARGDKKNYPNEEKLALGELVEKYKKENFASFGKSPSTPWLLIFRKFSTPPTNPAHLSINICKIFQPPSPLLFQRPAISDQRVFTEKILIGKLHFLWSDII